MPGRIATQSGANLLFFAENHKKIYTIITQASMLQISKEIHKFVGYYAHGKRTGKYQDQ